MKKILKFTVKKHRGRSLKLKFGSFLIFGQFGIKSLQNGLLHENHLEMIRRIIKRESIKRIKYWYRLHINHTITAKPKDSRMGKGKGEVLHNVVRVKSGKVFFEVFGITKALFIKIFVLIQKKLPLRIKPIFRSYLH
jgi:large subunit ribosomal protein L16